MTVLHVLWEIEPGDPFGVLTSGLCGSRVPTAVFGNFTDDEVDPVWTSIEETGNSVETWIAERRPVALVLAWDGKGLREGQQRALERLVRADGREVSPRPLPCDRGVVWTDTGCGHHVGFTAYVGEGQWLSYNPWGYSAPPERFSRRIAVPKLLDLPKAHPLLPALALATVCASRLGGRAVVLP